MRVNDEFDVIRYVVDVFVEGLGFKGRERLPELGIGGVPDAHDAAQLVQGGCFDDDAVNDSQRP